MTKNWVKDLLGLWAGKDWRDAHMPLGLPAVSPMFRHAIGSQPEEELSGYSTVEVKAMAEAVDWLSEQYPDHWRALSREIRPWTRRDLQKTDNDEQLVAEAMKFLEKYVDDVLD